jgi:hypothetical protein
MLRTVDGEPNGAGRNAVHSGKLRRLERQSSLCVFIPTENLQEHAMPYLFWAVLPFALMDTWWGMCEQQRDTSK